MTAGSAVRANSTANATAPAAARPMDVSIGTPARVRPTRAMMTVRPANSTALPAVAVATAIDSAIAMPRVSWARCRETMSRA
nr:hypothetical protein [Streptomyces radicis]